MKPDARRMSDKNPRHCILGLGRFIELTDAPALSPVKFACRVTPYTKAGVSGVSSPRSATRGGEQKRNPQFMLHDTKDLYGSKLVALDGDIGHVKDFYFDDNTWVIRYIVADTGSWLTGRLVLISPHVIGKLSLPAHELHVGLHRKQIENSPSIEAHKPVSRQYELDYYRYYGWPAYWNGSAMWGMSGYPVMEAPTKVELEARGQFHHREDKHLQSALAVVGYSIRATDGLLGTVNGFMVHERSWAICEMVVETGHWYSRKKILISHNKIESISYEESTVFVNLTKADLKSTAEGGLATASSGAHEAAHSFD
jgi:hypothetical protein